MTREHQWLYAAAYTATFTRQKQHHARFLELQRRRNPCLHYEFQRGDYVLANNQKAASLTPTYMGPFLIVILRDNANATMQTDDSGSRPTQRWNVRKERVVPYRYDYRCYDATTPSSSSNAPAAAGI